MIFLSPARACSITKFKAGTHAPATHWPPALLFFPSKFVLMWPPDLPFPLLCSSLRRSDLVLGTQEGRGMRILAGLFLAWGSGWVILLRRSHTGQLGALLRHGIPSRRLAVGAGASAASRSAGVAGPAGLAGLGVDGGGGSGGGREARRCVLRRRGCGVGFAHALGMPVRCGLVAGDWLAVEVPWGTGCLPDPGPRCRVSRT